MDLSRAADLLEVDIANAKRPSMGAEPEVRIPVSMARVYLEAMREADLWQTGAERSSSETTIRLREAR